MRENKCGSCTMCCKLMGVEELSKPVDTWCVVCDKGKGCGAYDSRPRSCREFECIWLRSQAPDAESGLLPPELRPDRCKAVLDLTENGTAMIVHVDPAFPDAYRKGALARLIAHASQENVVFIRTGAGRRVLGPERKVRELMLPTNK